MVMAVRELGSAAVQGRRLGGLDGGSPSDGDEVVDGLNSTLGIVIGWRRGRSDSGGGCGSLDVAGGDRDGVHLVATSVTLAGGGRRLAALGAAGGGLVGGLGLRGSRRRRRGSLRRLGVGRNGTAADTSLAPAGDVGADDGELVKEFAGGQDAAEGGLNLAVVVVVQPAGDLRAQVHTGRARVAGVDDRLQGVLVPS